LFQIGSPLLTRRETVPVVPERPAHHVHDGVGDRPESLALVGAETLVAGQQDERPRGVEPLDDDLREATLLLVALRRSNCPRELPMGSAILPQQMKRSMQLRKRRSSHGFWTYSEITIT